MKIMGLKRYLQEIIKKIARIYKKFGITGCTKVVLYHTVVRFLLLPYFRHRISNLARNLPIRAYIKFSFSSGWGLMRPIQRRLEIEKLLSILESQKPKYILEIVTAKGGTLFLFSRVARADAYLISVDLFSGDPIGSYAWKNSFL